MVLDTSHLARLVNDSVSSSRDRRRAAQAFIPDLVERGWLPLLCWHHLEELLQHRDDQLVDARLRYLWNWPLMAWVRPSDAEAGPGSILDVLKAEVVVAHSNPSADALQVRDLARDQLLSFGPATVAIPDDFRDWRALRTALAVRQEHSRRVSAISRWRAAPIDNTRIADLMNGALRSQEDAARTFGHLRHRLESEIVKRGDKRIV